MFSPVDGVVTLAGKPVSGAEITRSYKWQGPDLSGKESVTSDTQGRFHFDATFESAILPSLFPHNPSILQEIMIQHHGKEYEAWMFMKGNYDENGELGGKPIKVSCELNDEASRDSGFFGICRLVD